jgi:hypothetical protein
MLEAIYERWRLQGKQEGSVIGDAAPDSATERLG